jgi:UDP-2,4-diacetamido-2,4,6-trideoxy-beta-L-altropyranose hydrolase
MEAGPRGEISARDKACFKARSGLMASGTILFRADANVTIGTGHVMRCLALAQAWQDDGGRAVFAVADLPATLERRLVTENFQVARLPGPSGSSQDAEATVNAARNRDATWVVVDGDLFSAPYLQQAKSSGARVLLVDDFAKREGFPADLILNPNFGATEAPYRQAGASARLLLGESYVMLRREFTSWHGKRSFPQNGRRILVTLGGSDPENLTATVAECLGRMPQYEITAVAGPGYPRRNELQRACSRGVRLISDPRNMREVMEGSDLAVIAAGGTLWELLYMGCAVLSYARNPVDSSVVEALAARRALCNMGSIGDFHCLALERAIKELGPSKERREQMAKVGSQTIDGKGALRVLSALREMRSL